MYAYIGTCMHCYVCQIICNFHLRAEAWTPGPTYVILSMFEKVQKGEKIHGSLEPAAIQFTLECLSVRWPGD